MIGTVISKQTISCHRPGQRIIVDIKPLPMGATNGGFQLHRQNNREIGEVPIDARPTLLRLPNAERIFIGFPKVT